MDHLTLVMSQPDEHETMSATLKIGQILQGKLGSYAITHSLYNTVWKATNNSGRNVIVKSVDHPRLRAERDILQRYQLRSLHIRPLLDEVDPDSPSHAIVLKWLDDDLQKVTRRRPIIGAELKFIAKSVLEVLRVLHEDGLVHYIKPGNILVNYKGGTEQISEVQLADFGSTLSKESCYAKESQQVGTAIYSAPEVLLSLSWSTSLNIWSFGATLISLIFGDGFDIFDPHGNVDQDSFLANILLKHNRIFGPFPPSYQDLVDQTSLEIIAMVHQQSTSETLQPFEYAVDKELSANDKAFLLRIMKLDPRDRPTVKQILEDDWFHESDVP
ncbi:hypothetical protein Q7P37_003445 [Cladosporium fusiforme]